MSSSFLFSLTMTHLSISIKLRLYTRYEEFWMNRKIETGSRRTNRLAYNFQTVINACIKISNFFLLFILPCLDARQLKNRTQIGYLFKSYALNRFGALIMKIRHKYGALGCVITVATPNTLEIIFEVSIMVRQLITRGLIFCYAILDIYLERLIYCFECFQVIRHMDDSISRFTFFPPSFQKQPQKEWNECQEREKKTSNAHKITND